MVVLDGASLTIESLAAVADGREQAILAPAARDRMAEAREVVERIRLRGAARAAVIGGGRLGRRGCLRLRRLLLRRVRLVISRERRRRNDHERGHQDREQRDRNVFGAAADADRQIALLG